MIAAKILCGRQHWFIIHQHNDQEGNPLNHLMKHFCDNHCLDPAVWQVESVVLEPGTQL